MGRKYNIATLAYSFTLLKRYLKTKCLVIICCTFVCSIKKPVVAQQKTTPLRLPSGGCLTNVQKHNTWRCTLQSHTTVTTGTKSRWPVQEVPPKTVNVTVLRPQSREQGVLRVPSRALVCCRAAQWPESTRAVAPLPSLCSSLPSHNIKTVPLCACILGNLPPTMESSGLSMGGVRCHGEEKQGRGR